MMAYQTFQVNFDHLSLFHLYPIFSDQHYAEEFCRQADILGDDSFCPFCNIRFSVRQCKSRPLGRILFCTNCKRKFSILFGSIFKNHNIPIHKIVAMIYFWGLELNQNVTAQLLEVSPNAVSHYFGLLREACKMYNEMTHEVLGGPNLSVEIDETQIAKHKYHRGRILKGSDIWIFGGICRENGHIFAQVVPNRRANTLLPIIRKEIKQGGTIYSDQFRAYHGLRGFGYTHLTVNHQQYFIDPVTGAHTQTVERLWRSLKKRKKVYEGLPEKSIKGHVEEFVWRQNNEVTKTNAFRKTLEMLQMVEFQ